MTQDRRPTSAVRRALAWALALAAAWIVLGALAPAERAAAAPGSGASHPALVGDVLGDLPDGAGETAIGGVIASALDAVEPISRPALGTVEDAVEAVAADVVAPATEIVVDEIFAPATEVVHEVVVPVLEVVDEVVPPFETVAPERPASTPPALAAPVPPTEGSSPRTHEGMPAPADRLDVRTDRDAGLRAPRAVPAADPLAATASAGVVPLAVVDHARDGSGLGPVGTVPSSGSATASMAAHAPNPSAPGVLGTSDDPALLRGAAIGAPDSDPPTGPTRDHPPTPD